MNITRSFKFAVAALLALSFAVTGMANAKAFSMTGQWYQNRGRLVDIPINGGPVFKLVGCLLQNGCIGNFEPAGGGIPGAAGLSAMGANPANFTIPPGAFGQSLGSQRVPISIAPTVVQLATAFVPFGPANPTQAAAASPPFVAGQPAVFTQDAWTNDAGQAGRAGPNFAWCPGVGGPACSTGTAATPAAVQGIIRYTAGANGFGGTMGMMLKGGGATSIIGGTLPSPTPSIGTVMIPLLAHLPIAGGTTYGNPQVGGVGYAFENTVQLGAAPLHIGFMTNMSTPNGLNGLITSTGPVLTTGGATMSPVSVPGDTNTNWGMPWTTGTISVMNTETSPNSAMTATTTLTAMGTDHRTNLGKGQITMVAGGTSTRVLSGQDFAALEIVVLNFDDGTQTPSMGPAGLATVALLMALSAGYALRGRFASES